LEQHNIVLTLAPATALVGAFFFIIMTENKFTYVQYSAIRGMYKIGFTRKSNGEDRRKSGTIYLPDLCIICICSFETITESQLKKMYQNKRQDGEWFDLNEVDLNKIKSIMAKDDEYFDSELMLDKLKLQIGMLCELQYRKGLQHGADFTKRQWITDKEISDFRHKGYPEGFSIIQDPISKFKWKNNERILMEMDSRFETLKYLLQSKNYEEFLNHSLSLQWHKKLWKDYNSNDLKQSIKNRF
jgi:hypothetical protein